MYTNKLFHKLASNAMYCRCSAHPMYTPRGISLYIYDMLYAMLTASASDSASGLTLLRHLTILSLSKGCPTMNARQHTVLLHHDNLSHN